MRQRSSYPKPFKAQVVQECLQPGATISGVANELDNTHCLCGCALKRISEDVSEKLDYMPGVFTIERHYPWQVGLR
jgi:hypothetical protein